ncbi:MAG: type II toxin-antitoxin system antitoxin, RelB/DinJ family [Nitrospira sp. WS110]|nr:type II toxin-antitoxin system antitoxin, RelB/DinJ family [Nitrospira sp. WS110]
MRKAGRVATSGRINTRIDAGLKKKVVKVFERLGLTEAEAIRLFYAQVDLYQGIPFPLMILNVHTRDAFEEAKHPEQLPSFKNFRVLRSRMGT